MLAPFAQEKIPLDYMPTRYTGNFLPVLYRAFEGWCSVALWWAFWFEILEPFLNGTSKWKFQNGIRIHFGIRVGIPMIPGRYPSGIRGKKKKKEVNLKCPP
jgi:hypothetical protein